MKTYRERPGVRERTNAQYRVRWATIGGRERTKRDENVRVFRAWLSQMKSDAGCIDCGERDARCLDFDHVRGTKTFNVAHMTGHGRERILEEVAKCEVRCANCHRKRTAERRLKKVV